MQGNADECDDWRHITASRRRKYKQVHLHDNLCNERQLLLRGAKICQEGLLGVVSGGNVIVSPSVVNCSLNYYNSTVLKACMINFFLLFDVEIHDERPLRVKNSVKYYLATATYKLAGHFNLRTIQVPSFFKPNTIYGLLLFLIIRKK